MIKDNLWSAIIQGSKKNNVIDLKNNSAIEYKSFMIEVKVIMVSIVTSSVSPNMTLLPLNTS